MARVASVCVRVVVGVFVCDCVCVCVCVCGVFSSQPCKLWGLHFCDRSVCLFACLFVHVFVSLSV